MPKKLQFRQRWKLNWPFQVFLHLKGFTRFSVFWRRSIAYMSFPWHVRLCVQLRILVYDINTFSWLFHKGNSYSITLNCIVCPNNNRLPFHSSLYFIIIHVLCSRPWLNDRHSLHVRLQQSNLPLLSTQISVHCVLLSVPWSYSKNKWVTKPLQLFGCGKRFQLLWEPLPHRTHLNLVWGLIYSL